MVWSFYQQKNSMSKPTFFDILTFMKSAATYLIILFSLGIGFTLGRVLPSLETSVSEPVGMETHNHQDHGSVETKDTEKSPEIVLEAYTRRDGSIDLKAEVMNFVFTPEEVEAAHRFGFGHGHLYINQKKSIRLYGEWINISPEALLPGMNTICVTLNTNNHAHYTAGGANIESCTTIIN